MNNLQLHTKVKAQPTSFRNAVNTLESLHQKPEHTVPPVRDNSLALPVQSAGSLGHENDHPREDTRGNGDSIHRVETDVASPHASSTTGDVNQATSAYLSLQHYSDYVVMVPTPRTSSPIPDRYPTSGKLQTDVSVNLELEHGDGDDDHEIRKVAGRQSSKESARNRGSSHLQKTVGRLKRYFGMAAACGSSVESRQDDASYTSKEAGSRLPQAEHEEVEAADIDKLSAAKRRTHSRSESLGDATVGRRILRPEPLGIHHQPERYQDYLHGELKPKQHLNPAPSLMGGKPPHRVKVSVDDLALATVVPGVRVRVPPRRQLSHRERPLTDSNHMIGTTQTGSWLNDARARSRANVERWLCQSRETDSGRLCSTLSRQQRHRRSVQRASHAHNAFRSRSRASETSDLPRMERSVSETDVRQPAAVDHFRSRDQHRMTSNSSSVAGTPSMAGSAGADAEGESRLGPSLVRLVAEIIEGMEQRSRDDSSAVWSGIRGTGTPASKIFQQFTSRVRNRSPRTVEDQCAENTAGQKESAASSGDILTPQDRNEASSEKTLTGKRENFDEGRAIESGELKSSGVVPSCSVAVLRQRLLRAVEGNSHRQRVTERHVPHRTTQRRDSETTTGNFQASSLINCSMGILHTYSVGILSGI